MPAPRARWWSLCAAALWIAGCASQGFSSHRFTCPDGMEARVADIKGLLGPAREECIDSTVRLLEQAHAHRRCGSNSECFAYHLVQASDLGCIAASNRDPASIDALRSLQALTEQHLCPVASMILEDCGMPRCEQGACVVEVRGSRAVASCDK